MRIKKTISLILALVMVFALCACGSTTSATEATAAPEETAAAADDAAAAEETTGGELILGTSADYAPFEFMYPDDNGDMVYGGIDVFAAEYIAEQMGMTLKVENMSFDYLLASLQKGDYDMVMAAMEATDERKNAADFSDPYYTDYPAMILVKADKADQFQTLSDFDGLSVAAQTATTKEAIVTDQMPGANLVSLQNVNDIVNQLVNDKIDAAVLDGSVALSYAATNSDLVVAAASDELGAAEPYCVAVQKGDPKGLLPAINAAIAKMNEENKIEEFKAQADELSGVAEEVSADAPADAVEETVEETADEATEAESAS